MFKVEKLDVSSEADENDVPITKPRPTDNLDTNNSKRKRRLILLNLKNVHRFILRRITVFRLSSDGDVISTPTKQSRMEKFVTPTKKSPLVLRLDAQNVAKKSNNFESDVASEVPATNNNQNDDSDENSG